MAEGNLNLTNISGANFFEANLINVSFAGPDWNSQNPPKFTGETRLFSTPPEKGNIAVWQRFDGLSDRMVRHIFKNLSNDQKDFFTEIYEKYERHRKKADPSRDPNRVILTGTNIRADNIKQVMLPTDRGFSRCDLNGVDLSDCDLSNKQFEDSNLLNSNLERANLTRVNVAKSNLRGANLQRTKCNKTNFSDADLSGAEWLAVKLDGTNLTDVSLAGIIFAPPSSPEFTVKLTARTRLIPEKWQDKDFFPSPQQAEQTHARFDGLSDAQIARLLSGLDKKQRQTIEKIYQQQEIARKTTPANPDPDRIILRGTPLRIKDINTPQAPQKDFNRCDLNGANFQGKSFFLFHLKTVICQKATFPEHIGQTVICKKATLPGPICKKPDCSRSISPGPI